MSIFFNISFVICIFFALSAVHLGFVDLYFYHIFIIIGFPILLIRFRTIEKGLFTTVASLFVIGLINVLLENNDLGSLIKIFLGVLIAFWYYYYLIKFNDFDLLKLFKVYYIASIYFAYIGFLQFFSFLIGFRSGYDFSFMGQRVMNPSEFAGIEFYPIHGLTGEPSGYALLLAPAVHVALLRLTNKNIHIGTKWQAIVIISSYILTQSSTAYFAIFCSAILINIKNISFVRVGFILTLLPVLIYSTYLISPKFQERMDSIIKLATGNVVIDAMVSNDEAHGSLVVLANHFLVAKRNAADHPLGTGLGSHHVAFSRYNRVYLWVTGYGPNGILLNEHDASSLFNRILSEMGWVGIILTILFIGKCLLKEGTDYDLLINHASLVAILTALLRHGHYFALGLPFFILCFYLSKKLKHKNNSTTLIIN